MNTDCERRIWKIWSICNSIMSIMSIILKWSLAVSFETSFYFTYFKNDRWHCGVDLSYAHVGNKMAAFRPYSIQSIQFPFVSILVSAFQRVTVIAFLKKIIQNFGAVPLQKHLKHLLWFYRTSARLICLLFFFLFSNNAVFMVTMRNWKKEGVPSRFYVKGLSFSVYFL